MTKRWVLILVLMVVALVAPSFASNPKPNESCFDECMGYAEEAVDACMAAGGTATWCSVMAHSVYCNCMSVSCPTEPAPGCSNSLRDFTQMMILRVETKRQLQRGR